MWEWNPHEEPSYVSLLVFPRRRNRGKGFSCPTHPKQRSLWSANHGKVQLAPPQWRISALLLLPLISALDPLCSPLQRCSPLLFSCQEFCHKNFWKRARLREDFYLWMIILILFSTPFYCIWWYDPFEPACIATWKTLFDLTNKWCS